MPTYAFYCSNCGVELETIRRMADVSKPQYCPECGELMQRDYQAENVRAANRDYRKPIVSDTLAISPRQIKEHKQLFPDIKIDPEGRPIFENYKQHDEYLKKTGFIKNRQKIRKKGKRIA